MIGACIGTLVLAPQRPKPDDAPSEDLTASPVASPPIAGLAGFEFDSDSLWNFGFRGILISFIFKVEERDQSDRVAFAAAARQQSAQVEHLQRL